MSADTSVVRVTLEVTTGGKATKSTFAYEDVPSEMVSDIHAIHDEGSIDFDGLEGPAAVLAWDFVQMAAQAKLEAMLKQMPPEMVEMLAGVAAQVGITMSTPPGQA